MGAGLVSWRSRNETHEHTALTLSHLTLTNVIALSIDVAPPAPRIRVLIVGSPDGQGQTAQPAGDPEAKTELAAARAAAGEGGIRPSRAQIREQAR